jgi:hypothetical protein
VPTASTGAVTVATPFTNCACESGAPSTVKVTLPVGVALPGTVGVTVAVKRTSWP